MGRRDLCSGAVGTSFQARRWFSLDPCGCAALSCSVFIHVFSFVVIGAQLISNSLVATLFYFAVYVPTALLALLSLLMASTTDPGAVPLGARPLVTIKRASSSSLGNNTNNNHNDSNEALPALETGSLTLNSPVSTTTTTTTTTTTLDTEAPNAPPSTAPLPAHHQETSFSERSSVRRCHKCQDNFKPPRAHHDSVTGRCIVKFDHFCPWVNNAVGALNHKFFCLFLLYTAATCVQTLLFLLLRVVHCGYILDPEEATTAATTTRMQEGGSSAETGERGNSPLRMLRGLAVETAQEKALSANTLYVFEECNDFYQSHAILLLLIASLVFLIFTCSMGWEQMEAIQTNQGKIARMKMRVGQAGTEYKRVTTEFNEMFGGTTNAVAWHWFFPLPVQFNPPSMKKVVLGFECCESIHTTNTTTTNRNTNTHYNSDLKSIPLSSSPRSAPTPLTGQASMSVGDNGRMVDVEMGDLSTAAAAAAPTSGPPLPRNHPSSHPTLMTARDRSSSAEKLSQRRVNGGSTGSGGSAMSSSSSSSQRHQAFIT